MRELLPRYVMGLLVGLFLGMALPNLMPMWGYALILVAVVVATEVIGYWGFSSEHWHVYRMSSYALYDVVVLCVLLGIFLGSGKAGSLLVTVGTLMSR